MKTHTLFEVWCYGVAYIVFVVVIVMAVISTAQDARGIEPVRGCKGWYVGTARDTTFFEMVCVGGSVPKDSVIKEP